MVCERSQYAAQSANKADAEFLYQEPDLPYKFHFVDEQWQRSMFDFMGLRFRRPNRVSQCGPGGTSRLMCNQTYRRGR